MAEDRPVLTLVPPFAPILREKAMPVPMEHVDDIIGEYLYPMRDLMRAGNGVGLAAPQVGVPLRFFLMVDQARGKVHIAFNPVIHWTGGLRVVNEEGCLSFPGQVRDVPRWQEVLLEWRTSGNEKRVQWFSGRDARVIQHEVDHLDGICIFP